MKQRILVLFAHPALEKSRVHKHLNRYLPYSGDLTFHDLYEAYPEFNIDVPYEQNLLEQHDLIVWQHPMYWYSCPPLLKQWIDLVLEVGWAYGPGGNALYGKCLMQAISSGGPQAAYQMEGRHGHTLKEFLLPFEQTARLCNMRYLPPFWANGSHRLSDEDLHNYGRDYQRLLDAWLRSAVDAEALSAFTYANDWIKTLQNEHGR